MISRRLPALVTLFIASATYAAAQSPLPMADPAAVGMAPERLARVDGVVSEAIQRGEEPGAVVVIGRRGQLVYRKAFGQRATLPVAEPMTEDTIFDAASLTKVIATATAVMILVEEGRLSFTDTVTGYIPGFAENEKGKITLLQLLTHYSGLRPDLDLNEPWVGYDTAISLACKEKPIALPGEKFIYSDINYFLLGDIVSRVSGQTLAQFAKERIFTPLGMKDTGFQPDLQLISRIAPSEPRDRVMLRGTVHDPTAFRMGGAAGHAGLFTTVDDLAIFAQMLLNQGTFNGTRILSPLAVLAMTTPQSPVGMNAFRGIGFDIRTSFSSTRGDLFPVGSFGHTGFTGTSLWIDPWTETFVIVFTSRLHPEGKGNASPIRKRVASVVAASILEIPSVRDFYRH
ncbi:MAG: class A beta-lactamase-related serine hydrolase [Acidobacteria bacterium]|nr:MAG: class A beta-lactamase-related serine hydrolase [Acidobacteriota bacterium]